MNQTKKITIEIFNKLKIFHTYNEPSQWIYFRFLGRKSSLMELNEWISDYFQVVDSSLDVTIRPPDRPISKKSKRYAIELKYRLGLTNMELKYISSLDTKLVEYQKVIAILQSNNNAILYLTDKEVDFWRDMRLYFLSKYIVNVKIHDRLKKYLLKKIRS